DLARAAQGVEVCARPGCTAERRPSRTRTYKFAHRPYGSAEWSEIMLPRCTGASLAKPRRRAVDRGDEL
ncbi:MAG TPA: hypothetical protein VNI01_01520, partial [Elusimicrobiota bacterium]|nr:hypothetical protein [Elusimicrobiota bacterium]